MSEPKSSRWSIFGIDIGKNVGLSSMVGGVCILGIGLIYVFSKKKKPKPKKRPPPPKKKKRFDQKYRDSIEACSKETYLAVLEALTNTMQQVLAHLSQMEEDIRRRNPRATRPQIIEIQSKRYSEMMENARAKVFEENATTEQACQLAHSTYQGDRQVKEAWEGLTELEKELEARGICGNPPSPRSSPPHSSSFPSTTSYSHSHSPSPSPYHYSTSPSPYLSDTPLLDDLKDFPRELTLERVTQIFTALMDRLTIKNEDAMRTIQSYNPQPSTEERESLIRDIHLRHIQEVQTEIFEEHGINSHLFDTAIQRYLQYPSFKATVDRLREEQRMTFQRLTQLYWPSQ